MEQLNLSSAELKYALGDDDLGIIANKILKILLRYFPTLITCQRKNQTQVYFAFNDVGYEDIPLELTLEKVSDVEELEKIFGCNRRYFYQNRPGFVIYGLSDSVPYEIYRRRLDHGWPLKSVKYLDLIRDLPHNVAEGDNGKHY